MVVKQRKKTIVIFIRITVASLLIAVSILFITGEGEFSLNSVFDYFIKGTQTTVDMIGESDVTVNIIDINNAASFKIGSELQNRIHDYFKLYYTLLGELNTQGESKLNKFYTVTSTDFIYDDMVIKYLISRRKNSTLNLSYKNIEVNIAYKDSGFVDNKIAEITLSEINSISFGDRIQSADSVNEHFFIFHYKDGKGWLIESHENKGGTSSYLDRVWSELLDNDGYTKNGLTAELAREYTDKMKKILNSEIYYGEKRERDIFPEYPYNRTNAIKYALEQKSGSFKIYKDNNMNFLSQCINAGSIPMDAQGKGAVQWKWYSDELNNSQQSGTNRTGYTKAWLDGNAFFSYINENTGFGIVALETSLADAEPGDLIQFLDKKREEAIYQCMITDKINSEFLVSSFDKKNIPLSAMGYDEVRVIKIFGYNT